MSARVRACACVSVYISLSSYPCIDVARHGKSIDFGELDTRSLESPIYLFSALFTVVDRAIALSPHIESQFDSV